MKWWLIVLVSLVGCFSPINADVVDDGEDVLVEPDPLSDDTSSAVAGSAVSFSMNADQFGAIAAWLGNENTLTIEKPVHVEKDNVMLDAKAGTRFSYAMGDDSGTFTFQAPLPTVKANFATKIIGGVALRSVKINADGSGVAGTAKFGNWPFRWAEDESDAGTAAATESLPEVWAYSQSGCPPCVRAKLELAAEKDLPFRVVWKDEAAPEWLTSRPGFWWHVSGAQPSQADVNNTRQASGWNGVRDFVERWKNSRTPKRYQRTASAATHYFARPDHEGIGSRSVAKWSINGDFTTSRSVLLAHLSRDGIHRGRHDERILNSLTTEQLRWLHDRDHWRE